MTSSFDWKASRQKLKFLLEVYGIYSYSDNKGLGSQIMVKVVTKIAQIQRAIVPDGVEDNDVESGNDYRDMCLF